MLAVVHVAAPVAMHDLSWQCHKSECSWTLLEFQLNHSQHKTETMVLQLEAAQTERIAELKRNLLRYTDELYAENHSMFEMHIRNMATEKLATAHYGPVMLLALGKVYVTQAKRSRGNVGAYFRCASHLLFTCCSPAVHLLFTCCSPAVPIFQSGRVRKFSSRDTIELQRHAKHRSYKYMQRWCEQH